VCSCENDESMRLGQAPVRCVFKLFIIAGKTWWVKHSVKTLTSAQQTELKKWTRTQVALLKI